MPSAPADKLGKPAAMKSTKDDPQRALTSGHDAKLVCDGFDVGERHPVEVAVLGFGHPVRVGMFVVDALVERMKHCEAAVQA